MCRCVCSGVGPHSGVPAPSWLPVTLLAFIVYHNTLDAGFVYDDSLEQLRSPTRLNPAGNLGTDTCSTSQPCEGPMATLTNRSNMFYELCNIKSDSFQRCHLPECKGWCPVLHNGSTHPIGGRILTLCDMQDTLKLAAGLSLIGPRGGFKGWARDDRPWASGLRSYSTLEQKPLIRTRQRRKVNGGVWGWNCPTLVRSCEYTHTSLPRKILHMSYALGALKSVSQIRDGDGPVAGISSSPRCDSHNSLFEPKRHVNVPIVEPSKHFIEKFQSS
ncbi:hypothetical protein AAG570_006490 [Ranatra chinensis]|uniref:Uncharacterized protein n=1 Tax=Ranatra chinensis TaxID=642074 RepID=A0ABD0Z6Y5_9HEMI